MRLEKGWWWKWRGHAQVREFCSQAGLLMYLGRGKSDLSLCQQLGVSEIASYSTSEQSVKPCHDLRREKNGCLARALKNVP